MRRLGYECTACGEFFTGDYSFRKHRVGSYGEAIYDKRGKTVAGYTKPERHCLTVEEMLAKDFHKNDRNQWASGTFDAEKAFGKKESEEQESEEVEAHAG